jgi:lipopolysaccharide transport system permease protein
MGYQCFASSRRRASLPNTIQHYLDVITVLAQKDFKIRYRNSVLGFLWSLLNPLAYMVILTVVFSFLLRVNIPNFPGYLLIGLLVWRFFSIATSQGLFSIIGNPSLVGKVYVPRWVIVLSNNLANFLGATLEFVALIPLLLLLGVNLTRYALFLPAILILEFLLVFAISLSLSSLNLKYRDFYQLWDIALQLGFFLSPIVYDTSLIPTPYRFIYSLNPVTSLIESARSIFLLQRLPSLFDSAVIISSIAIFLLIGVLIFRRLEARFAEEL